MESFIDRLAELLKDLMAGKSDPQRDPAPSAGGIRDPDVQAAWEELEDYMRRGKAGADERSRSWSGSGGAGASGSSGATAGSQARRPSRPDESLRQDYANLEVPFGADMETVRSSYKSLMLRYHPDRFASDPEKQRVALEITKKINESFERIRSRP